MMGNRELFKKMMVYEHVYQHAPMGIAILSLDRRWVEVNPAICKMFGYSMEELSMRTTFDITYPDDMYLTDALVQELLNGEIENFEVEKRFVHKEGHVVWTSIHVSLLRDPANGEPRNMIVQIIDITNNKATEQKLIESVERYTSLKKIQPRRDRFVRA
ncbi:PAS domain S-box protein [Paenibacillus sp. P26]|nr:PAS domain S-box protein [Paenibacillus sp. P26]